MHQEAFEEKLLKLGLINSQSLEEALRLQKEKGGALGDILVGLGAISEHDYQYHLAQFKGLKYYTEEELKEFSISFSLFRGVPYQVALINLILPIYQDPQTSILELATLAPLSPELYEQVKFQTQSREIIYSLATRESLGSAIRFHYGRYLVKSQTDINEIVPKEGQIGESLDSLSSSQNQVTLHREGFCVNCGYPRAEGVMVCPECGYVWDKPADDPLVGNLLDETWRLKRRLGEGGMGMIYEGVNIHTNEPVAIKLLRMQAMLEEESVRRFYHEAHILHKLNHPNIVRVLKFGFQLPLGFYLVMELLEGCDLKTYLTDLNISQNIAQLCGIFSVVCDAMEHAHQKNIIHRDLKPGNIFIVGGPEEIHTIKVLDFGIAKDQKESFHLTQAGMTMGTPRYLSPEQAMGLPLDNRSDIYSLSVLLFESLTGRTLFKADSPYQYAMKHAYSQAPTLAEVRPDIQYPPSLHQLMKVGLAKKKEDRPSSMLEMQAYLKRAIDELELSYQLPFMNFHLSSTSSSQRAIYTTRDHEVFKVDAPEFMAPSLEELTQQLHAFHALFRQSSSLPSHYEKNYHPTKPKTLSSQTTHLTPPKSNEQTQNELSKKTEVIDFSPVPDEGLSKKTEVIPSQHLRTKQAHTQDIPINESLKAGVKLDLSALQDPNLRDIFNMELEIEEESTVQTHQHTLQPTEPPLDVELGAELAEFFGLGSQEEETTTSTPILSQTSPSDNTQNDSNPSTQPHDDSHLPKQLHSSYEEVPKIKQNSHAEIPHLSQHPLNSSPSLENAEHLDVRQVVHSTLEASQHPSLQSPKQTLSPPKTKTPLPNELKRPSAGPTADFQKIKRQSPTSNRRLTVGETSSALREPYALKRKNTLLPWLFTLLFASLFLIFLFPQSREIIFDAFQLSSWNFRKSQQIPDFGYITIHCHPEGALVRIGKHTRLLCPVKKLMWPVGKYDLTFSLQGYRTKKIHITIQSKKISTIHYKLLPIKDGLD